MENADIKKFIDTQIFGVDSKGNVCELFGDPIVFTELGILTFSKAEVGEHIFNMFIPDEVSYSQLNTFEKNTGDSDLADWKYRVYHKVNGIYDEYKYEGEHYVPNAVIGNLIYNMILERKELNERKRK